MYTWGSKLHRMAYIARPIERESAIRLQTADLDASGNELTSFQTRTYSRGRGQSDDGACGRALAQRSVAAKNSGRGPNASGDGPEHGPSGRVAGNSNSVAAYESMSRPC